MFAYPYGEFDEKLEGKLEARGWLGFGQQSGAIGRYSHSTRLPRFPMANSFGQLGSLKDKLLSKAFPVPASELPDGVLEANPPELVFELGEKLTADRLTCFASGQGRIEFRTAGNRVSVRHQRHSTAGVFAITVPTRQVMAATTGYPSNG